MTAQIGRIVKIKYYGPTLPTEGTTHTKILVFNWEHIRETGRSALAHLCALIKECEY